MKLIDRHNKVVGPRQKTETITLISFAGGINLADNPLALSENELLAAENWQYAPTGAAIETRDAVVGKLEGDGTSPPSCESMYIVGANEGVVYGVVLDKFYDMPGVKKPYPLDLLRCSDFTYFRYGLWRVDEIEEKFSDFNTPVVIP